MNRPAYLLPAGEPPFVDRHYPKAAELLVGWDGVETLKGPTLIGVPISKPSISHSGASFTPAVVRKLFHSYSSYALDGEVDLRNSESLYDAGDIYMHATDIKESYLRIEKAVVSLVKENKDCLPMFIGGDHSITYSTIKALSISKNGKIGIIQFDAHHDLRNTEDGGPTNGTPFRRLLEGGVIEGENLVQIGIRNYSNSSHYHQYAKEQAITVYTMSDVKNSGILNIMKESIRFLKEKVDHIYISIDIDVLDQAFAPGCPAIGPGGMTSDQLLEAILLAGKEKTVCGLDIVEIDPTMDFRDMTSRVAVHCVLEFLRGRSCL
ncbi:formimidoylglutamase [Sutcliffiella rhizosphaerae]|uniref:Formimidoylglutamase n=1 Tax=Sutcliffiella rhizosphaerae TaxID=2880967 RepID=A0ABN8AAB4_9BACI|nr:formimidoylglutamase [Sutcliffiella rhizosphaerae]CAG9620622.1 Formimidoylglutamase [Sutcliffiella rhizosphaerae]